MTDLSSLKVYSPGCQAVDWGFDYHQLVDLETALAQPTSIAAVPVYCDRENEFSYLPQYQDLDLSQFDLVLFTDIQFRSQTELTQWIAGTGASQWLLSVAGLWDNEMLAPNVIYRPTWMFTFLQWNAPREDFPLDRAYLYDCLCGTRRAHRDYIMYGLAQSGLLDKGIATYRDIFPGHEFTETPWFVKRHFRDIELPWPYVSANLDPQWEVRVDLDNSISSIVPWEIYNRTWFTVLLETIGSGTTFLAAEKIGKCLHARRLFVHVGRAHWLTKLRSLGFETFGSVMDESYDSVVDDITRWQAALKQIQWLCNQNLPQLLTYLRPVLDHNHSRLYAYRKEIADKMAEMIANHLK